MMMRWHQVRDAFDFLDELFSVVEKIWADEESALIRFHWDPHDIKYRKKVKVEHVVVIGTNIRNFEPLGKISGRTKSIPMDF